MDSSTSPRLSTLPPAAAAGTKGATAGPLHFALCGLGGALAGGLTHRFQYPSIPVLIDTVAKKPLAQSKSRFRKTVGSEGGRVLANGWRPLSARLAAVQGASKFALYDGFKNLYGGWFSEENAYKYRHIFSAFSALTAQYLTNQVLFPFENFAFKMHSPSGAPFRSISEILRGNTLKAKLGLVVEGFLRIRNATLQFVLYEEVQEQFYDKSKHDRSVPEQLVKTFAAGYIAGSLPTGLFFCPDVLVCKRALSDASSSQIFKQFKLRSTLRVAAGSSHAVGAASGLQWLIYEGFKIATGISRQVPPTMPDSLRKKMEEAKVKEQKPIIDLSIDLPSTVI